MNSSIAVGVFDGLHLGHREILNRALARAREHGGRSVVVSFDPHPDVVLSKSFQPSPPLTPHSERRALLTAMGCEIYEVVPFTRELAALEADDFVERYLIQPFGMRDLVVGANFALGHARSGDVNRLRELGAARGFEVEVVPLLEIDGAPVSSTRIRKLLTEGRVAEAARLLGRRYSLSGIVVTGDGIGSTLGVPTANLRLHQEKFLPADGVYAAWARIGGDTAWRPAAMSLGIRPTFGEQARALEVHLLHWNGELLGRELEVELQAWIRSQLKFESPEALAAAMQADLQVARTRLDSASAPA
jgi:riboflavin kinase / FMN adenylyltransferase